MSASRLTFPIAIVLALLCASPAAAATPFTAGTGSNPGVAVGGDGSGHVAWATPNPTQVGYCRVSAGAAGCNRTELLSFPVGTNAQTTGKPRVFTPAAGKVVIVAGCWQCGAGGTEDRTYRWTSTDNGDSFGVPVEVSRRLETNGGGIWLDDVGQWVGVSGSHVKAAALTTFDGVDYATGGLFVYGPEIARVPGSNELVAATNDLDTVKYGVYTGPDLTSTAINNTVNWIKDQTLPAPEGDNSETALNAGPNGIHLSYLYFVANDSRLGLRRYDPATNTFGAPAYVEGADPIDNNSLDYPDSFQDPSGRIHVVWRSLHDDQRLRYRVSDTSGANFTAAANLAMKESFSQPEIAAGADGKGFVTWTPNVSGDVRIVAIDPQPEPVTTPPPGGGGTPPPGGGGTPGPTIVPQLSLSGPGNSATAVIVGRRIRVRMRGSIALPAGAAANLACSGKVRLKLKKGRRTMLNRTVSVKMRKGKCRFRKTVYLNRAKVGRTRKLRLKVRFMGNTVLKAGSLSKTLIIRR